MLGKLYKVQLRESHYGASTKREWDGSVVKVIKGTSMDGSLVRIEVITNNGTQFAPDVRSTTLIDVKDLKPINHLTSTINPKDIIL